MNMSQIMKRHPAYGSACLFTLDQWLQLATQDVSGIYPMFGSVVPGAIVDLVAAEKARLKELHRQTAEHLHHLNHVDPDASPEELDRIAGLLSPSLSVHGGGLFASIVRGTGLCNPLLLAALIYRNAQMGKVGFQFLDDPATVDRESYDREASDFLDILDIGLEGDPLRVLLGTDVEFYEALADTITIYRGCSGVDAETAALGVCWTIHREWADWFATRSASFNHRPPIVITARVPKSLVRLAMDKEQELVTRPARARQIKHRPRTQRPDMEVNHAA